MNQPKTYFKNLSDQGKGWVKVWTNDNPSFSIGTKVWINWKSFGCTLGDILNREGAEKPKRDKHGRYVGWVLGYKDFNEPDIYIVGYHAKNLSIFGGDWYRGSDIEKIPAVDFLPQDLFEI